MPSSSRSALAIGALLISASLAHAGNKAAFDTTPRDAMPDITPILKTASAPPQVAAVALPRPPIMTTKPSRHRSRIARKMHAPTSVEPAPRAPEVASKPVPDAPASATASAPPAALDKVAGNVERAEKSPGPPPANAPGGPREVGSPTVAQLLAKHAEANGVPLALAQAVVRIESRGNVRASNGGALGLMQIKYGTARAAGFNGPAVGLFTADTNLHYGMKVLGQAFRDARGDTCGALMRYQSGHLATRFSAANRAYCSRARAIMAGA